MMSAVTYLTLGTLLARIHKRRALKVYFLALAGLLTFAVGISRVYLGVHWPTDVLAGWAAGRELGDSVLAHRTVATATTCRGAGGSRSGCSIEELRF